MLTQLPQFHQIPREPLALSPPSGVGCRYDTRRIPDPLSTVVVTREFGTTATQRGNPPYVQVEATNTTLSTCVDRWSSARI